MPESHEERLIRLAYETQLALAGAVNTIIESHDMSLHKITDQDVFVGHANLPERLPHNTSIPPGFKTFISFSDKVTKNIYGIIISALANKRFNPEMAERVYLLAAIGKTDFPDVILFSGDVIEKLHGFITSTEFLRSVSGKSKLHPILHIWPEIDGHRVEISGPSAALVAATYLEAAKLLYKGDEVEISSGEKKGAHIIAVKGISTSEDIFQLATLYGRMAAGMMSSGNYDYSDCDKSTRAALKSIVQKSTERLRERGISFGSDHTPPIQL